VKVDSFEAFSTFLKKGLIKGIRNAFSTILFGRAQSSTVEAFFFL